IFQDDNAACHRAKTVKTFLEKRHIRSISWPANSPDINPIENIWLDGLERSRHVQVRRMWNLGVTW
uniref:Tc1-like transposase DDE domain-containing protein n=1 Tax=Fundulus heteroclitus TaxID=8078 RepID=A0A3Q2QY88_FUNHE